MTDSSPHDLSPSALEVHPPIAHVMSFSTLMAVYATLIVLTVLTVAAATPRMDFGSWNLWIAMIIATAKAGLVALYFMHLRYDSPFNGLLLVTALVFLGIFLGITLLDVIGYQPDIQSLEQRR